MLTQNQQGIIFMLLSVICFSTMDILVKFLSASYPTFQLVLFRGVFGLIPIFFIIPKNRYKNLFYTSKIKLHSVRAIAGAFAMIFLFLGLKYLPIADAIAISFAAPVFATIFSIIFLKETVRIFRWIAIITGLVGVLIILKPGTDLFSFYAIYPILFCIGFGIISIAIKKLSSTEPDYLIALYFTVVLIIIGSISCFFQWETIKQPDLVFLILIGISGSLGNIFLTKSIRHAEVSKVTPIKYLSLIFATISGIFIFNEIPSLYTFLGSLLIITSTAIIIRREAIRKIKTTPIRQV